MQNNKDLIIFTYDFPFGKSEKTFIQYEIKSLLKDFNKIEIINHKSSSDNILTNFDEKKIHFNNRFSKSIDLKKIIIIFFKEIFLKSFFWKEVFSLFLKKNFFRKLKMCLSEVCLAYLLTDFIKKERNPDKEIIFYSFWCNFPLISFIDLKKVFKNSKFLARGLGSDINGYIKDDDYIPFKKIKFITLDKLVLLGDYQKKSLENLHLENKIEIAPLGVYPQIEDKIKDDILELNEPITFVSCGNLIEIKNNLLMINFLNKFSLKTNKKIRYIMIGDGQLKNKLLNQIKNYNQIEFRYYKFVENFVNFLNQNKAHFLLNFSSQEGMPFTIMEAMSCGIPAITSNIKPNEYLVKENGFLFDLNNYEKSIMDTIYELNQSLDNRKIYNLKSKKSYDYIHKYLINANCYDQFKEILNKL
jgi:glycosyltransferase involved in cell wall biosynthesis